MRTLIEYTEYEKMLNELVYFFNPCRKDQLRAALTKCFVGIDEDAAEQILLEYQAKGRILFSSDGWAMTKGKYLQLTGDSKESNINFASDVRLTEMDRKINNLKTRKLIHCLWILVDMLPDSLDFVITNKPFQITFFANGELYEVIDIPEKEEDLRIKMLRELPSDYYDDVKKGIKRVAIMENPDHSWKIPEHIGFKFIVTMDETKPSHYRFVEKRTENW